MSKTEEHQHEDVDYTLDLKLIPIAELWIAVWDRRRWLAKVAGIGMLLALGITLLIPNEYTSMAQLMPPDQQTFSTSSMLSALSGSGLGIASVGSSLMNQRTPGATSIGILSSRTSEDDIINRFDLRRVYHCKFYADARKELARRTVMDEDKKTGIVSISVTDSDRYRARDIAEAYVKELDKLVNNLSTSSARREREFLEDRLKSIKADLDDSSRALSQFSSRNATMDPQKQGEATVEAAARLQGELITAESELSGLEAMYTDENVRVREVRARIGELRDQLRKIGGQGESEDGSDLKSDQLLPSVRKLPLLGVTYYDLYRRVTLQESLYETLTKQYELARVQEAKEIPPIKILDDPEVPERKSSPHRLIITLVVGLLSALAGTVWIVVQRFAARPKDFPTQKVSGTEVPTAP